MTAKKTVSAPAEGAEKLAPATKPEASGAIVEPAILDRVDMDHPSIDATPRERSTADMNRIDMNTPSALQTQEDAVIEALEGEA